MACAMRQTIRRRSSRADWAGVSKRLARSLAVVSFVMVSSAALCASRYDEPRYDVRASRDIVYGVGAVRGGTGTIALTLDLYEPIGAPEAYRPVLVTVHGGGFLVGDKSASEHVALGEFFASRGFAVVSINYRLGRDAPPADPEQVANAEPYLGLFPAADIAAAHAAIVDTKTALRWVHANAEAYGFDSGRVFLMGDSAGGFCAVIAGTSESEQLDTDFPDQTILPENHPDVACDVEAIVDLWGGAGPWIDAFDADDPPMMLVYGTDDWLYEEGERLRDRCEAVGMMYEWVPLEGWEHGAWEAPMHGLPCAAAILGFLERQGVLGP